MDLAAIKWLINNEGLLFYDLLQNPNIKENLRKISIWVDLKIKLDYTVDQLILFNQIEEIKILFQKFTLNSEQWKNIRGKLKKKFSITYWFESYIRWLI